MFDDAARYLKNEGKSQNYDVIICDSSDPVGPAEVLFQPEFFTSMRDALSPTGVLCTQGECQWLHLDLIEKVIGECRTLFPTVRYAYTAIPTYPSGQIGFIIATKDETLDVSSKSSSSSSSVLIIYINSFVYLFKSTKYAYYHIVLIYLLPAVPSRPVPADLTMRFYTSELHKCSFVLPGEC